MVFTALRSVVYPIARYSVFKEPVLRLFSSAYAKASAHKLEPEAEPFPLERLSFPLELGGEYRVRTGDLLRAKQALSQLS